MSKLTLAAKLADEVGTSTAKASRFIDDVGPQRASRLVDDADDGGKILSGNWWKPAGAVAGGSAAVGGGALAWRQQDVRKAEALAQQRRSYADAVGDVIEADLPGDLKRQMIEGAARQSSPTGQSSSDNDDGLIPDDPATLIVLVIVMALVLKFALDDGAGIRPGVRR